MKITIKALLLMLTAFGFSGGLQAQDKFTAKEAVEYAKKHNQNLQKSHIDQDVAKQQVKSVLADGLPQVSANASYNNNIQIPTQRLPNFINAALPPGSPRGPEFINAQFGVANVMTVSAQLNQLIFDGTYFLGLKAAREFVTMSDMMTLQTERMVELNVVKTYYAVLMADERMQLMDENLRSLDSTLNNLKAMVKQGFAETVDTARISLSMSNLKIQRARLDDQHKIMLNMLKLQMGYDVNKPIELTENTESLESKLKVIDVSASGNMSSRPEYQIIEQQLKLGFLDKKRYTVGYYPTLRGFINHQQNTFANKGELSQLGNPWYPGTTWGLTLNVPIFSGFRQKSRVEQAALRLEQYQLNKTLFEQSYQNEVFTARTNYERAVQNLDIQRQNMALANEIKRIAKIKLQEGLGTSLEYTTAEAESINADANMVIALYEIMIAELDYRNVTGGKIIE